MENVAEKFSNYQAFQFHFGDLVVEKVGKDDYIAHRPGTDTCVDWIQHGSKEYINGWMYGAVQRECGQIHKEPTEEAHVDQEGICPVCGAELEFEENVQMDGGGVYPWTRPACGATGKQGYNEVFDGHHYDVRDGSGKPFPMVATEAQK